MTTIISHLSGLAGQTARCIAHTATRVAARANSAHHRASARRQLMMLDGHVLNDIGTSRWEIETLS